MSDLRPMPWSVAMLVMLPGCLVEPASGMARPLLGNSSSGGAAEETGTGKHDSDGSTSSTTMTSGSASQSTSMSTSTSGPASTSSSSGTTGMVTTMSTTSGGACTSNPGDYSACESGDASACGGSDVECIATAYTSVCAAVCNEDCDCPAAPPRSAAIPRCGPIAGQPSACYLDCSGDEACPDTMTCRPDAGTSYCTFPQNAIYEACEDGSDCETDLCALTPGYGVCTQPCSSDDDCPSSGTSCEQFAEEDGLCFRSCDDDDDCPSGMECDTVNGPEGGMCAVPN